MLSKSIVLFLLSCTLASVQGAMKKPDKPYYNIDKAKDYFQDYIKKYNKAYEQGEAKERFKNFVDNLHLINELNSQDVGTHGINKFADMSDKEFASSMFGGSWTIDNSPSTGPLSDNLKNGTVELPPSIDWRQSNVVSPARDQGSCGTCWAFSAVATIESRYAIQNGILIEFSEKQLVDCLPAIIHCNVSSNPFNAFTYLAKTGMGLESRSVYPPYIEAKSQCQYDASQVLVRVANPSAKAYTEESMAEMLVTYGPISVFICPVQLKTYIGTDIWKATNCPSIIKNCTAHTQ